LDEGGLDLVAIRLVLVLMSATCWEEEKLERREEKLKEEVGGWMIHYLSES